MSSDKPYLKKAHTVEEFTSQQVFELKKCMADPVYFAKHYCHLPHPVKGSDVIDLYPYQEKMLRTYQNNRNSITLSARQTGKEQPHSANIATPTGWVTMGEIQPGDYVLTPDGIQSCVVGKFPQGVKDVYEIVFDDGSKAECGLEHLWTVYIRNQWDKTAANGRGGLVVKKQTLTTKDMIEYLEKQKTRKNSSNYNIRIPVVQKVNFHECTLPLDPYLLGLLLGDGCLSQPNTVMFTTKDEEILSNIKPLLETYNCDIKKVTSTKYDYHIKSNGSRINTISNIIKELNLCGTKSATKFIPEAYKTASHEQRLALLQGLMDTDGTVSRRKDKCTISYCTTSSSLRDDVQQLVWSLGGKCSYYIRKPRNENHQIAYELFISLPYPKDCFRLSRKRELCHNMWHNNKGSESEIRRTVKSITKIRQEESSCIMIDHVDHLYITNNYTVTHNTAISCIYILWFAMFHFEKTILIVSNKNDNAKEMVYRIKFIYERLPSWLKSGLSDDGGGYNKHALAFDNGSRIISQATSANSGRGMAISLLFCDEFAFVRDSVQDEFWTSISPTLATGGDCIIASTPNGDTNLFAQLWRGAQAGSNGFEPVEVKWNEPPGRDESFKKAEIGKLGLVKWEQEYECRFVSSDPLLIDTRILESMTNEMEKITPTGFASDIIFYKNIKPNTTYLVGMDPATGTGKDFTTIVAYEFPSLEQVAEWRSNTVSSPIAYGILKKLLAIFNKSGCTAYYSVENNGVGEGIIALMEADEAAPDNAVFISETGQTRVGMTTTGKSKMRACMLLKDMVERNTMKIKSKNMLGELKSYVRSGGAYNAKTGSTDDLISAHLIVIRVLNEMTSYEQSAYDTIYTNAYRHDLSNSDDYQDYDSNDTPLPMLF